MTLPVNAIFSPDESVKWLSLMGLLFRFSIQVISVRTYYVFLLQVSLARALSQLI